MQIFHHIPSSMSTIGRAYLPLVRAVRRKFAHDLDSERKVISAIRSSLLEMKRMHFPEDQIISELDATRNMLNENLAQVAFSPATESYTVRLTEDHLKSSVVDIQSPEELRNSANLEDLAAKHCNTR